MREPSLVPETWLRDQTLIEGGMRTWKKEIVPTDRLNTFVETITTTDDDGSLHSHWKLKFKISRANGPTLVFRGFQMASMNLKTGEWSGWQDADIAYTFQIDEAFWYEFRDLTNDGGLFTDRRIDEGDDVAYHQFTARKMAVLEPMIGTSKGSVYRLNDEFKNIPFKCRWRGNKTVIAGVWPSDDGSFEAPAITSFNPAKRAIVKHYHPSSGDLITSQLINAWEKKLLWEPGGDTPSGRVYERCLFDYSVEGQRTHKILERTLNGVSRELIPDILLKNVSE